MCLHCAATRLLLLAVAASNEGVAVADSNEGVAVVTATRWDVDCVTVDDKVTSPFTPDVSDAFDELAD